MIYFAVGETEWVEDECEDLSATACPARWECSSIIRNLETQHDYWPGESSFCFQLSALMHVLALKLFKIRFVFPIWVPPSQGGDVCASSKKIVWISSNLVCSWLCFVALRRSFKQPVLLVSLDGLRSDYMETWSPFIPVLNKLSQCQTHCAPSQL